MTDRFDPPRYNRRSIRLKGYDYSQPGAYFVTLVAKNRVYLFGEIEHGQMRLNDIGRCAADTLTSLQRHFSMRLDAWVIMPNHMHCILAIHCTGEASDESRIIAIRPKLMDASPQRPIGTNSGSLGAIIQNYKSISTRRINTLRRTPGVQVWQRNYYEHIIRDEADWQKIADYIENNPSKWAEDRENRIFYRRGMA